jgi:phosphoglycolate phosphatase
VTFDAGKIRAILFDLDGTLIDSQQDIADAANALRQARGMDLLPLQLIASYIGDGIEALVRKVMGQDYEAQIEPLVEEFRSHYHDNCVRHTSAYDGVGHTLQLLHQRGYAMAVVTNKPERISVRILELLGMAGFFGCVIGGNSCGHKKPHPEPLQEACRRLGVALEAACMVGDSRVDIEAGNNAGIPALGLLGGIGDEALMRAAGPALVLGAFTELGTLFKGNP